MAAKQTQSGSSKSLRTRVTAPIHSLLSGVPEKFHAIICAGTILLLLLVFFGGMILSNKIFAANDAVSWESFRPFIDQTNAKGESPLWIPYIFSGMPAFGSYLVTGDRWWDLSMKLVDISEHVFGVINYLTMRMVMYYFLYGIGMYLLARSKKMSSMVSLFVAVAGIFSAWIIVYMMIGHNTKMMTLMTFPFIILCLDKLIERFRLLYAGLLVLAVHVMWESNHPQTAFYGICAIGIYLGITLVSGLMKKGNMTASGPVRAGLALVVAAGFTYGMGLDRNMDRNEYTPFSTRIQKPITDTLSKDSKSDDQYDYMTNWSFSVPETFTYIVPSYFGSGKLEYNGEEVGNTPTLVPTYWGQMMFTDTGHYAGIIVLILAVIGIALCWRNPFVLSIAGAGFFGLVLSYGRNFPVLYNLFYSLVPNFNQLRAPSQSLILLEFALPLLAGFGLQALIDKRKESTSDKKWLLFSAIGMGGFSLLGFLIKGAYMAAIDSMASSNPQSGAAQVAKYSDGMKAFIYNTAALDWFLSGLFGAAALLMLYFFMRGTLALRLLELGLLILLIVDLWHVDRRPMETKSYNEVMAVFDKTDVDQFLESDKSKYRILDLTAPGPNYPARQLHEHIMGYHAAKLRSYQNLLDVCGNTSVPTAPTAWNMLNMKYIISDKPIAEGMEPVFQSKQKQGINVYRNDAALPRAWFVEKTEVAKDIDVLTMIRDAKFDPKQTALLAKPLATPIQPADASCTATVKLFEPNHIALDVNATGNNFLVISEIYYPPTWKAKIDGKPAEILQTDYLLRGLVIPPGKHTVTMDCEAEGLEMHRNVVLGLNALMFVMIIAGAVMEMRKPKEVLGA